MFNLDSVEENVKSDNYIYSFLYNKSNEVLAYVYTLSVDEIYLLISDLISYFNSEFFYFSDFQLKILKVFLIILLFNIILVIILWNLYKDRIFERFMQPATSCVIEELRKSVSQLKLPRGHSPRI